MARIQSTCHEESECGLFLRFLERDITEYPERMLALNTGLVQQIQSLIAVVNVDLDAPLPEEDE